MTEVIKIGISTCLLGENVRYDGGHKLDRYLRDTLGQFVQYVPVCPEVECGLSTPREAMHLVGDPESPRLVTVKTRIDHTERMKTWARKRLEELEREDLCGYVFKKNSPSSGLLRVKVYNEHGVPRRVGVGIWARAFTEHFPLIPVEEEGRLNDPVLRETFIDQIFTMKRWRAMLAKGRSRGALVEFHTQHKLLLMAHSPEHYRRLGKLVAESKRHSPAELFATYQREMIEALRRKATPNKNYDVLLHLLGYFKKELSAEEKQELLEVCRQYKEELVPLVVPVTLINHYVRKYAQPYLLQQFYLQPHPVALKLRNHA